MICLIFFNPFVESDNIFLKKSNYILRIFPFRVVHTVNMMKKRFIFCGLLGWCLEIFWTGLQSLQRRQLKLMGHSSIWMFPIYGMAFLFAPIFAAAPEKERLGAGQRLCGWDFPDRVSERHVSEKTGHLPLGLQSCPSQCKRGHKAGLRAGLVSDRTPL